MAMTVLLVIGDPHNNNNPSYVTDPAVVAWFHRLDAGKPECCGRPMEPWGPRDPDLFHCLHCHRDQETRP